MISCRARRLKRPCRFTETIITGLTRNASYLTPAPTLTVVQVALDDFANVLAVPADGGTTLRSSRMPSARTSSPCFACWPANPECRHDDCAWFHGVRIGLTTKDWFTSQKIQARNGDNVLAVPGGVDPSAVFGVPAFYLFTREIKSKVVGCLCSFWFRHKNVT